MYPVVRAPPAIRGRNNTGLEQPARGDGLDAGARLYPRSIAPTTRSRQVRSSAGDRRDWRSSTIGRGTEFYSKNGCVRSTGQRGAIRAEIRAAIWGAIAGQTRCDPQSTNRQDCQKLLPEVDAGCPNVIFEPPLNASFRQWPGQVLFKPFTDFAIHRFPRNRSPKQTTT